MCILLEPFHLRHQTLSSGFLSIVARQRIALFQLTFFWMSNFVNSSSRLQQLLTLPLQPSPWFAEVFHNLRISLVQYWYFCFLLFFYFRVPLSVCVTRSVWSRNPIVSLLYCSRSLYLSCDRTLFCSVLGHTSYKDFSLKCVYLCRTSFTALAQNGKCSLVSLIIHSALHCSYLFFLY